MQHFVILIFLVCFIIFNSSCQVTPQKSRVLVSEKCQSLPTVKSGDTLLVKFEEFPGRGYSWQLKEIPGLNDTIMTFLGKFRDSPIGSNDDSRQLLTFRFVALKKGKYLLQFEYRRPWEKDKPATQECKIQVDIQ